MTRLLQLVRNHHGRRGQPPFECVCMCGVCSSSRGHPLQADERVEQDAAHRREEGGQRRLRHDLAEEVGSGLGLGLALALGLGLGLGL